jgi:hypothetical protein
MSCRTGRLAAAPAAASGAPRRPPPARRRAAAPRCAGAGATLAPPALGGADEAACVPLAAGGAPPPPPPPPSDNGGGGGGEGGGGAPAARGGPLALLSLGVAERLSADPFFLHKLGVECGLDAAIIVGINLAARRERFAAELDLTLCHLAISLLSDFALVYLLAPRASSAWPSPAGAGGARARLLAALPAHVFQAGAFPAAARVATLALKGVQYGAVGLAAGAGGAAAVRALLRAREALDPSFAPPARAQSPARTGAAWAAFMATSSNARYNVVNALEQAAYGAGPGRGKAASLLLRLVNNYAGAAHWVAVSAALPLEEAWTPARRRAGA